MEIKAAVTALAALAQETRLSIYRLLVEAGPDGLPAGQIGEALKVPGATLSFHLKELARAGLVVYTAGKAVYLLRRRFHAHGTTDDLSHSKLLPRNAAGLS